MILVTFEATMLGPLEAKVAMNLEASKTLHQGSKTRGNGANTRMVGA